MHVKPIYEKQPQSIAEVSSNKVINRVYQNRGIQSSDELDYDLKHLLPYNDLKGIDEAVPYIAANIMSNSRIVVLGDYDCDGATATTIAVRSLRMLGAKEVIFVVPDRTKHGYGLSPSIAEEVMSLEPNLVITVDNGIASIEGAARLKELDSSVHLVITDHHLPADGGIIPTAEAIVNPNQDGCPFESKALAGCGVIFYVMNAVKDFMESQGWVVPGSIDLYDELLDILTIGTICDVVPFDYNNRIIVKNGIEKLNFGARINPGLRAMLEVTGCVRGSIDSSSIGFSIGPMINAAGRLDDMSIGINCLTSDDPDVAKEYALELKNLNEKRKEISSEMEDMAMQSLLDVDFDSNKAGVCVHNSNFHEGVVGILASRVKDKVNRPTIVFTDDELAREIRLVLDELPENHPTRNDLLAVLDGCEIKGSARSVTGVHLKHILDAINKSHPDILTKFGGHSMAAGVGLKVGKFEEFQRVFAEHCDKEMTDEVRQGRVDVDIKDFDPSYITLELAELIKKEGPWGNRFDKPIFSSVFKVVRYKILKEKHLKLTLCKEGTNIEIEGICFGCIDDGTVPFKTHVEVAFDIGINEWQGQKTPQLMIQHLQDASPNVVETDMTKIMGAFASA